MKNIVCFLLLLLGFGVSAQVTIIVEQFPKQTAKNAAIFISGDFEDWSGGQKKYQLEKRDDIYVITLPKLSEKVNFKFTQGSWETVECDKKGLSLDNRSYMFIQPNDTLKVKIAGWNNLFNDAKASTAAKNVSILSDNFKIPQLNRERRIWLYLPPDYELSNKSYPVVYMNDGQNLFDTRTSYAGEWEVDEILNKLFKERKLELIVVGIDNGGENRMDEYSPWKNEKYGGGEGDSYLEFIVANLKPYIDSHYNTLSDKNNTAIMGSSMGGLISFYAGLKYPNTFGKIGVFSPSFWIASDSFQCVKPYSELESKMFFLVGDSEGGNMVQDTEKMVEIMKANGFIKENIYKKIVPGGEHGEKLWSSQFEQAILWLYSN